MNDRNDADLPSRPIFSAVLTPHRSLTPRGLFIVMALLGVSSFITGAIFLMAGAWPVPGFMGLDVVLVYFAFRLNNRQARAFEEIAVTREALTVRKVDARGVGQSFGFDPYWTRLEVARKPEWGVTGLWLATKGERLAIGRFLNPDDRESFAAALSAALAKARSSPDMNDA
jgi:uncharacterized membrane protein